MSTLMEPIDSMKPSRELSLWETLDYIAKVLREGAVEECVEVDGGVVRGGLGVYWALRRLGARYAPTGGECRAPLEELGYYHDFAGAPGRVYSSGVDLLVRGLPTPMVMLRSYSRGGLRVWAKLEWFNPFSLSVKDKAAYYIVEGLRASGGVGGRVLGDASSSNFGVALAGVSAYYGARAKVYLPANAEDFGRIIPRLMGASVVETDVESTVRLLPRVIRDSSRGEFVHANQFMNDRNFEAHLRYTAKEIDYQARVAGLKLSGVAGSIGTSGHMAAVNFYFKSRMGPGFPVILAQPTGEESIPGIRRAETGMIWLSLIAQGYSLYDVSLEESLEAVMRVARVDGLAVSPSGGAALAALERHLEEQGIEGDVVVVVPDTGFKYLALISKALK